MEHSRVIRVDSTGANAKRRLQAKCGACGDEFTAYTASTRAPAKCKKCELAARRERHRRRQERRGRTVNPRGPTGKPRSVGLALIDFMLEIGLDRGFTSLSVVSKEIGFTPNYLPGVAARIYRAGRTTIPIDRYERILAWLDVAPDDEL